MAHTAAAVAALQLFARCVRLAGCGALRGSGAAGGAPPGEPSADRRDRAPPRPARLTRPGRATWPLSGSQRALQLLEHAHHAHAAAAVGARRGAGADALQEVLALDAKRLRVGDAGAVDVARTRDVLPPRARVLVESLVIDRQLALEQHVVEGRHPARAHERQATLLVRVKPRQV